MKSFNKKRMIEKNTIGINHDFNALKNRIKAGNESFRANFLRNYGSGSTNSSLIIPQSAIQRPPLGSNSVHAKNQSGLFKDPTSRKGSIE